MQQNPSVLKTQHCVPVVLERIFNCIGPYLQLHSEDCS